VIEAEFSTAAFGIAYDQTDHLCGVFVEITACFGWRIAEKAYGKGTISRATASL
jgi:hypothetical protein